MTNSKILITGGAGYIGSHTVNYLVKNCNIVPEKIVVFDNLVYGHKEFLPEGVTFIKGDLTNELEINKLFTDFQINKVIHFAAYAYVGESMNNPGKYYKNNILGGVNLLEAMRKNNCKKIVFSSTCAVYGLKYETPLTENMLLDPINPYGESKLFFEKILKFYDKIYNIKYVALRYFNAAGAGYGIGEFHEPETHLIPLTIYTALNKRNSISIFGNDYKTKDGTCIRDYIHVIDLADAHYKSLLYLDKEENSNIFNLGTGMGSSVFEIINLVKNVSKKNFKVKFEKRRSGDPPVLIASNEKIENFLNWYPKYNIKDIIESAWLWHSKK